MAFSEKFYTASENKVLEMTGCLPGCDFYKYSIEYDGDVVADIEEDPRLKNTLHFQFYFKSAKHELKEQVRHTCPDI